MSSFCFKNISSSCNNMHNDKGMHNGVKCVCVCFVWVCVFVCVLGCLHKAVCMCIHGFVCVCVYGVSGVCVCICELFSKWGGGGVDGSHSCCGHAGVFSPLPYPITMLHIHTGYMETGSSWGARAAFIDSVTEKAERRPFSPLSCCYITPGPFQQT